MFRGRHGQAPVHHQNFSVGAQHDIGRLQIAMDNETGMSKRHGITDPQQDVQVLSQTQLRQSILPFDSFHLLHGIKQCIVRLLSDIVDRDNIWMIQSPGDDRLGDKRLTTAFQSGCP